MTLEEIKSAVSSGGRVHWVNNGYEVIKDDLGQWLIKCHLNDCCVGLAHRDGATMNGEPDQFYVGGAV